MNHEQLAHVWAQQTKASGTSGNLFFRDSIIFSYGTHWPIARFVRNETMRAVLINATETRSVTTSRHTSYVHSAIPDNVRVFDVPDIMAESSEDHLENATAIVHRAVMASRKAKRARSNKATLLESATRALQDAQAYALFFNVQNSFSLPSDIDIEAILENDEKSKRQAQSIAQAMLESNRAADAERFSAWFQGIDRFCPSSYTLDDNSSVYLRVLSDRGVVQTSRGAEVPISHAARLLGLVTKTRESKATYTATDNVEHQIRVGHFTLQSIDKEGNCRIGCHYISWERIQEIADLLVPVNA